jgi:hypothetical protein
MREALGRLFYRLAEWLHPHRWEYIDRSDHPPIDALVRYRSCTICHRFESRTMSGWTAV